MTRRTDPVTLQSNTGLPRDDFARFVFLFLALEARSTESGIRYLAIAANPIARPCRESLALALSRYDFTGVILVLVALEAAAAGLEIRCLAFCITTDPISGTEEVGHLCLGHFVSETALIPPVVARHAILTFTKVQCVASRTIPVPVPWHWNENYVLFVLRLFTLHACFTLFEILRAACFASPVTISHGPWHRRSCRVWAWLPTFHTLRGVAEVVDSALLTLELSSPQWREGNELTLLCLGSHAAKAFAAGHVVFAVPTAYALPVSGPGLAHRWRCPRCTVLVRPTSRLGSNWS